VSVVAEVVLFFAGFLAGMALATRQARKDVEAHGRSLKRLADALNADTMSAKPSRRSA